MAELNKLDVSRWINTKEGYPLDVLQILGVRQVLGATEAYRHSLSTAKNLFREQYDSIFSFEKHISLDHYKYQGYWGDLPLEDLLTTFLGIKKELDAVQSASEGGGIEFLGDIRQEEASFEDFLPMYRLWVKLNSCFSRPGNGSKLTQALTVIPRAIPLQPLYPSWVSRLNWNPGFFTGRTVVAWWKAILIYAIRSIS